MQRQAVTLSCNIFLLLNTWYEFSLQISVLVQHMELAQVISLSLFRELQMDKIVTDGVCVDFCALTHTHQTLFFSVRNKWTLVYDVIVL